MLSRNNLAFKALRYDTWCIRVHTVLPATKHEPYLPLFASRRASPSFGQYSLCLPTEGWPGWVDLGGWLDSDKCPALRVELDTVTHPSTDWARHWSDRRYQLCQTSTSPHGTWRLMTLIDWLLPMVLCWKLTKNWSCSNRLTLFSDNWCSCHIPSTFRHSIWKLQLLSITARYFNSI